MKFRLMLISLLVLLIGACGSNSKTVKTKVETTLKQTLDNYLTANIEGGNSNTNYTYSWSTGEINATINATASIPYSVTGTNILTGCSKTDIVQVKF